MPRKRRIAKPRIGFNYDSNRDDMYLLTSHDFFGDCPLARDENLARAVWRQEGARLLEQWTREGVQRYSGNTGRRTNVPWALEKFGPPALPRYERRDA